MSQFVPGPRRTRSPPSADADCSTVRSFTRSATELAVSSAQACGLETATDPAGGVRAGSDPANSDGGRAADRPRANGRPIRRDPDIGRLVTARDVVVDREFEELSFSPSVQEEQHIEQALALEGCREPLIVWPCQGRLFLLVGYHHLPALRRLALRFRVVEHPASCRAEALRYLVAYQLRNNRTELQREYLLGRAYLGRRQSHGGAPRGKSTSEAPRGKTAEALAETFGTSAAAIRRAGELAAAVDRIAANGKADGITALLLGQEARLTHRGIVALAGLPAEGQRDVLAQLRLAGRLPRSWRTGGEPATITLPLAAREMAEALLKRRGPERTRAFAGVLLDTLAQAGYPLDGDAATGPWPE